MKQDFINKIKTCCISGHRKIAEKIDRQILVDEFINLIKKENCNTFLIGMAVGFDMLCFDILEDIRKTEDIKLIACVPCDNQHKSFSQSQREEYFKKLNSANQIIFVSHEYTPYCMSKRNKFMVDNSNFLVCYLRQKTGGTRNTYNYAKKQQLKIIEI